MSPDLLTEVEYQMVEAARSLVLADFYKLRDVKRAARYFIETLAKDRGFRDRVKRNPHGIRGLDCCVASKATNKQESK